MATPDATRLKELIERERLNLGIEYKELAARAGLAPETLRALRSSGRASSLSKRRVEDVLGWQPGSVDAVLAGGDPKVAVERTREPISEIDRLRAENAELRAAVGSLTSENASLAIQVEEVEVLHRELLELRAEVERLRRDRSTA